MRNVFRQRMAQECSTWFHDALISPAARAALARRYGHAQSALSALLRWVAIFSVMLMAAGVLGFIAAVADSAAFGGLLLLGCASAAAFVGVQMAQDPLERQPYTAAGLVTLALLGFFGSLCLWVLPGLGSRDSEKAGAALAVLSGLVGVGLAYGTRLRWPLTTGLLMCFHGVGAYGAYLGGGSYAIDVQDPRSMLVLAGAVVALGVWHERHVEAHLLPRHAGFGLQFMVWGLLYHNLSTWILSLENRRDDDAHMAFVALAVASGVVQLVLGARLRSALFTGFGVVFLAIQLYTQMFDLLWEKVDGGLFLMACGAVGMGMGFVTSGMAARVRAQAGDA